MKPNIDVLLKLTKARAALLLDQPFFGALALRLKLEPMSSAEVAQLALRGRAPTLSVNGRVIKYCEVFIESLSMDLVKSAIAHEVGHCVFEHISRRGVRDPSKWNQAGDYVINAMLKDSGFSLGTGWLYNAAYASMSADEIYNLLPDGGRDNSLCDIEQCPPEESEIERNEWQTATVQAANVAKAAGCLPEAMKRFVEDMLAPKVDWRAQLRRFVTEKSKNDYSWARPNKRFMAHGFVLPSMYSENMGLLVCGIDTSGSIDQAALTAFGSEIQGAWDAVTPNTLTTIYCDAEVNHVDHFNYGDTLHFDMHGGGGTDLRCIFNRIEEDGIGPSALVVLTDGYTPFPSSPPNYPVLWCMTTDVQAPFGETIRVEV